MGKNALPIAFRQVQYLVAELHITDLRVTEPLAAAGAQAHIVPGPEATKSGLFIDSSPTSAAR